MFLWFVVEDEDEIPIGSPCPLSLLALDSLVSV